MTVAGFGLLLCSAYTARAPGARRAIASKASRRQMVCMVRGVYGEIGLLPADTLMLLKPLTLLAVGVSGWALGHARPEVRIPVFILALFAAVSAHSTIQWAFLNGRLDRVLGDPSDGAQEAVIVLIAAGEAVGLWLPFLILPWAQFAARVWVALYALAAATLAAVYFYRPFDLIVISEELIAPDGPPYLFAALGCLPIAAVGFFVGWMKAQTDRVGRRGEIEPS